jgi:polar amino acid transport system substrate-binding protein
LSIPVEIAFFPWKRAQEMVKRNSAHGFFAASQANQRDEYAVLSATIAPQEWRWYLLKTSAMDPRSEKFKTEARTSSFNGANMRDWLIENGYNAKDSPPQNNSLLTMLIKGRVDAILANQLVMDQLLAQSGRADAVKSYPALNKPLGIYFSKAFLATQLPDYLTRWNQAITGCTSQRAKHRSALAR